MDPGGRSPETPLGMSGTLSFHMLLLFLSHLKSILSLETPLPQPGFVEVQAAQNKTCSALAVAILVCF